MSASAAAAVCRFIATLGGTGRVPKAPGTAGTAVAAAVCAFLPTDRPVFAFCALIAAVCAVPVARCAEQSFGRHDDSRIVIDEFCGYMAAVALLPRTWPVAFGAFALFRLFDIWKPSVIRMSQRLPHGYGIVADDLLAGVATNIILRSALSCAAFLP